MNIFYKLGFSVMWVAFGSSSLAYAGHAGDIGCDPSWRICLQSDATNSADTLHFITGIGLYGTGMDLAPNFAVQSIYVNNDSPIVFVHSLYRPDFAVGQITEGVGADGQSAMSRELVLAPGMDMKIDRQPGGDVTYCNVTALGFVYERATHHTLLNTLSVIQTEATIAQFTSTTVEEPAYLTIPSPVPCSSQ